MLTLILWQRELIAYGIGQAQGQLHILLNAQPITKVLNDPSVPDSLKQKIRLVQEIRTFAIDSLGVNDSDSYRSVYDQQGKPVLWVITACEPFSLEDKQWNFPVIGSFSYKGFFDHVEAIKQRDQLRIEGYDTGIRTVNAWSTLGIFDDPILSGLLFRSEGSLANTIIHELTHGTVFVKDSLKFNENLASFVGNKGAEQFLAHKYGKSSAEYQEYVAGLRDRRLYSEHMLRGMRQLDSLYQSFPNDMAVEIKSRKKEEKIRQILLQADTLSFTSRKYNALIKKLQTQKELPNNTFFKSFARYQASLDTFERTYARQFDSNLKNYLTYLKKEYE